MFPPTVKIKTDLKQAAAREHLELIHCCSALDTRGAWKLVAAIAFCVRQCRLQNHSVTVRAPPAALNEMAPKVAAGARKKVDRRDPYRKLSSEEIRLAQLWHAEDDMGPSEAFSLQTFFWSPGPSGARSLSQCALRQLSDGIRIVHHKVASANGFIAFQYDCM